MTTGLGMTETAPCALFAMRCESICISVEVERYWVFCVAWRVLSATHAAATSRNSTSATTLIVWEMVNVRSGGVKNQLRSRLHTSAAVTAGHSPPTSATTTVSAK